MLNDAFKEHILQLFKKDFQGNDKVLFLILEILKYFIKRDCKDLEF